MGASQVSFDPSSGAAYADAYLSYDAIGEMAESSDTMFSAQASNDVVANYLQGSLNIIGLLPELETIGNGANAVISLARGNTKEAALYAGAAFLSGLGVSGASAAVKIEEAAESISEGAELVEDAEGAIQGGVYSLRDADGNVVRTGRTNNLAKRAREHARDPDLGSYDFEVKYRTNNYAQQRGLEQLLHETYNPVLNKIRPISPSNRNFDTYMQAARDFFGSNK